MKGVPVVPKKCVICGELFIPAKPSTRICPKAHYAKCPICGKDVLWNTTREVEPCSRECRKILTKRKNLEKYGVEHPMQSKEVQAHHRQAMLDKYGVESPLQSKEIKERAIQTNREKFGSDWALGNKDIHEKIADTMQERYGGRTTFESPILREKIEQTWLEKYGVDNPMKNRMIKNKLTSTNFLRYGGFSPTCSSEVLEKAISTRLANNGKYWTKEMQQKAIQTSFEHYGYDNPSKSPEIKQKIKDAMIDKYGENYGIYLQRNMSEQNIISNINRSFMAKLNEAGVEGEFEYTGISNYRYDIAVPSQKTLIEIDPTYTHNTIGNHWASQGIDPLYHKQKSVAAKEAGFRCIHVFDWDDWNTLISSLSPRKRVHARKCRIYKLQPKVVNEFLDEYHLQGTVRGQLLCLGLVYEDELVQVMTFGEPRYNKKYYCELLRLCTKPGVEVVGGASKLFSFATKKLGVENVISYCDLAKFNGEVYEKIGMKLDHTTEPQEIWSKNDKKITANLLRQRGYDQLFNANFGKGTSNEELMLADGWLPVYDCGQAVYTF